MCRIYIQILAVLAAMIFCTSNSTVAGVLKGYAPGKPPSLPDFTNETLLNIDGSPRFVFRDLKDDLILVVSYENTLVAIGQPRSANPVREKVAIQNSVSDNLNQEYLLHPSKATLNKLHNVIFIASRDMHENFDILQAYNCDNSVTGSLKLVPWTFTPPDAPSSIVDITTRGNHFYVLTVDRSNTANWIYRIYMYTISANKTVELVNQKDASGTLVSNIPVARKPFEVPQSFAVADGIDNLGSDYYVSCRRNANSDNSTCIKYIKVSNGYRNIVYSGTRDDGGRAECSWNTVIDYDAGYGYVVCDRPSSSLEARYNIYPFGIEKDIKPNKALSMVNLVQGKSIPGAPVAFDFAVRNIDTGAKNCVVACGKRNDTVKSGDPKIGHVQFFTIDPSKAYPALLDGAYKTYKNDDFIPEYVAADRENSVFVVGVKDVALIAASKMTLVVVVNKSRVGSGEFYVENYGTMELRVNDIQLSNDLASLSASPDPATSPTGYIEVKKDRYSGDNRAKFVIDCTVPKNTGSGDYEERVTIKSDAANGVNGLHIKVIVRVP